MRKAPREKRAEKKQVRHKMRDVLDFVYPANMEGSLDYVPLMKAVSVLASDDQLGPQSISQRAKLEVQYFRAGIKDRDYLTFPKDCADDAVNNAGASPDAAIPSLTASRSCRLLQCFAVLDCNPLANKSVMPSAHRATSMIFPIVVQEMQVFYRRSIENPRERLPDVLASRYEVLPQGEPRQLDSFSLGDLY